MPKQTFQITETKAETEPFSPESPMGFSVTVIISGCDAFVDFDSDPNADNGGVITQGVIFKTGVNGSWKASFKSVSGSGWITFWY